MDVVSLFSCFWLTLSIIIPGTGASPTTVNGARGRSVSLSPGIPVRPDIADVDWYQVSTRIMIVKYSKRSVTYFGTEEYKRRITLHLGDFSLEIRDLRREDSGDYEVMLTKDSGAENKSTVRLEVYELVSGTNITVLKFTGTCELTLTCSVTSGDNTSFRWLRGGEAVVNDTTHHLWGHGETLKIHHTTESGAVVYKCEARNLVSVNTAQIRLEDVCKLDKSGSRPGTGAEARLHKAA
ncbi:SLAM family member 5-like isoform X2 [Hypanus sabinus]|uniref:SLAM family member 5-like isoform X2 n=1 Tax=Hypanus sabinus TaxID=79690 RepID=UPI0028C490C5|nr:SLAM family member 5-like isoform X2 [Hypanus sabinus]